MTTAGSLAAALLATLTRPAWWALALAGFLVRGGALVLLLPIVRLPTAAGLSNDLAPTLIGFVLGGASAAFLALVGAVVAATIAWLVAAGLIGGWMDLALVRGAAEDDELEDVPSPSSGTAFRALIARAGAHIPTAAILTWGAVRLVDATYQELISPAIRPSRSRSGSPSGSRRPWAFSSVHGSLVRPSGGSPYVTWRGEQACHVRSPARSARSRDRRRLPRSS